MRSPLLSPAHQSGQVFGGPVSVAGHFWPRLTPASPEHRRLALGVLAALLLHLSVLAVLGLTTLGKLRPPLPTALILHWSHPPSNAAEAPAARAPTEPLAHIAPEAQGRPSASSRSVTVAGDKAPDKAVIDGDTASSPPATAELIENARTLARSMAREQEKSRQPGDALRERPFLPELDRALAKHSAGETRLANGLIRVTTASGTTYCLQPLPDFSRGGPADMLSVPTTCP